MKKYLLTVIGILSFLSFTRAQNVSDIKAQVSNDNKIHVSYKITGARFYQTFNIYLYISSDNGKTFAGPMKEVSGDVGDGIKEGNHVIIWDALKEMPFTKKDLIFDVRAITIDNPIKKKFFVSYVGNLITPVGVRIGNSHKLGWYIEARASLLANEKLPYNFVNGNIENWDKPGYYQSNGTENYSAYSIGAGLTFQLSWNTFFYLGGGYGSQKRIFEVYEYNNDDNVIGNSWVVKDDESYTGAELSAGFMQRFGSIIISVGGTFLNFETPNFTAGIGFSF